MINRQLTSVKPLRKRSRDRESTTGYAARRALIRRLQRHALDRDAMHQAALALIVIQRIVPGCPVIPEGDRAFLPFEPGLKFRPRRVLAEEIKQRLALLRGPAFEMG